MPKITTVGRVLVPVSDQDKAIAFYTTKLGFSLVVDVPYGEGDRWVEVAPPAGGTNLALVPPQGDFRPGRLTGIGLESPDVRADHTELKERGVDVDDEVLGGEGGVPLLFFFRDDDGNQLMIAQPQG